jgi:hypothetical protein
MPLSGSSVNAAAAARSVPPGPEALDFVILDKLGYLPFAQAGGQLLFP